MPPASSSDPRLKWPKRKRQKNQDDGDDDDEGEGDHDEPEDVSDPSNADPILDFRRSEVLADARQRISDFPLAFRRSVNRPHLSVVAVVAAERFDTVRSVPQLENVSHGQMQAAPAASAAGENSVVEQDKAAAAGYVCVPPVLMEGKGVEKRFENGRVHLVPVHSDWFSFTTVNRLERQMVPHFFSGKSTDHTPEKYMELRNKIISRYLDNPTKRLALVDCQGLVPNSELYDLSRIVRFLDHWGIINYLVPSQRLLRMAGSLIKEDDSGELDVQTSHLRSIDSLILFDRPKCSARREDIGDDRTKDSDVEILDLDMKIRERLSEHACSYCSCPLPHLHYQSQKEADTILCSDCFHDGKFIVNHSSIDFVRVDSRKDAYDLDGDNWTDQETLLLLEALEKYKDNWNEIAEYVGTKSKAQCIHHFLRIPVEDALLENIDVMPTAGTSDSSKEHDHDFSFSNTNGDTAGVSPQESSSRLQIPFANSANPVMSLVAFLASAIAPRVAAACASASLAVLTKGDPRLSSDNMINEVGSHGAYPNLGHRKGQYAENDATSPLGSEHVKFAAMCGLSAAATKAKMFADQEEREVQRLAANIINHQLRKLELKLKQFAELETSLSKECEQIEKNRQRLCTERVRMMSAQFGAAPGITTLPPAAAVNTNARPPSAMPASAGQANMQFIQRQQMYGFGPRLPLSAIHPSSSSHSQNAMFSSGIANNTSTSNHHPLLRSSSGNTSNIG